MKVSTFRLLAIAAAVALAPAAARAEWLNTSSGNSVVVAPDTSADGVINFAVWHNTGSDWTTSIPGLTAADVKALNLAGVDKTAQYVYMYQVANTNPAAATNSSDILISLQVAVKQSDVSSFGYLDKTVFKDAGGNVGAGSNTRLDTGADANLPLNPDNTGGNPLGNGQASFQFTASDVGPGLSNQNVIGTPSAATAAAIQYSNQLGSDAMQYQFSIPYQGFSNVVFFTSNQGPIISTGATSSFGLSAWGDVASLHPTPEPGTMALLGLGLPLVGIGFRRLRKRAPGTDAAA